MTSEAEPAAGAGTTPAAVDLIRANPGKFSYSSAGVGTQAHLAGEQFRLSLGLDLVRRAEAAGAHVLVLTLDVPVRTTRPREAAVGLGGGPFRPDLRMILGMLGSPGWLAALDVPVDER